MSREYDINVPLWREVLSSNIYIYFIFIMIVLLVIFVFDDNTVVKKNKVQNQIIDIHIDSKPYKNDELTTIKYVNNPQKYNDDLFLYNQTNVDDLDPSYY